MIARPGPTWAPATLTEGGTTMFKTRRTRQLEHALRKLADAVAVAMPGSHWDDDIDEAVAQATELIGPMGPEEPPAWRPLARRRRQRAREDQAWAEGYNYGEEEVEEALAEKDDFIAVQSEIIDRLGQVLQNISRTKGFDAWEFVPEDLRRQLADYV